MVSQTIKKLIFTQVDLPSFLEQQTGRKMRRLGEGSYKCTCPFPSHKDNNPSFSVEFRDGGWKWYCYGCGTGGSIIQFYKKYFDASEEDAVKAICELYDIEDDPRSIIRCMERSHTETPYRKDLESYYMRTSIECRTLLRDYPGDRDVVKFVKDIYEKSNAALSSSDLEEIRHLFGEVKNFSSGGKS